MYYSFICRNPNVCTYISWQYTIIHTYSVLHTCYYYSDVLYNRKNVLRYFAALLNMQEESYPRSFCLTCEYRYGSLMLGGGGEKMVALRYVV